MNNSYSKALNTKVETTNVLPKKTVLYDKQKIQTPAPSYTTAKITPPKKNTYVASRS